MKIAYIANSRFPSEKAQSDHVMAMCSAFAAAGHEVMLFVPDRRPVVAEDPFVYYQKSKNFGFERVPCVDALRWPWLGAIGLWIQTATFVRNLRARLSRFKPDVVYSREIYTFGMGRVPGARIWESHALPKSLWAKRLIRSLDGIVTLTNASRDRLVAMRIKQDRVLVEPDAVDPSLFIDMPSREAARARFGISSEEFLCLYTGKLTTMGAPKGLDEAIDAVRRLRADGKSVRLLAVGGTPDEVASFAREEGVELLGHQPQHDLKRFYAAADLLLMPFPRTEHYAYYMSPLKLFEYLMSGVPMVVTDLPSVREILSEKEAFIAKPGNVESLANEIVRAMNRPDEAAERAARAKEMSQRYTWEKRAGRIIAWLQNRV